MQRDISPEERLLALIKGKHKKPLAETESPTDSKVPRPERSRRELSIFKNKIFEPAVLRSFNKYLAAGLIILIVYFIFDSSFVRPYRNVQAVISQPSDSGPVRQAKGQPTLEMKDYSHYSKEISGKKIFGPSSPEEERTPQTGKDLDDISKNLNLVGIVAGENPQAIIEDRKNQKTYYLNEKQTFNGFIVEDISEGKVVLDYGGKKVSLFL